MACKYREELVGKRFISVRSPVKLKINKISEWEWRSGIVRAISTKDTSSLDLSVLIEFDDIDWTRREWVRVHDIFQLFLVEHTLVWAERPDPDKPRQTIAWPGLSFRAVVDKVGLSGCKRKPVEFLVDKFLGLVEEKEIQIFQEGEENNHPTAKVRVEVKEALKAWLDYQDGQKILLTTPTVLVGYRLEVYRAEGTTQWYTAVIQSYNHTSKTLSVTDDTVLEEHNEDPTLIQMQLIDDSGKLVDSILRGVEIGITPRRRPRQVNREKEQQTNTTKTSSSGSSQPATTVSRSSASRKLRQPAPASPAPSTPPDVEKADQGSEKAAVKSRSVQRDRKRKVEPEAAEEPAKKSQSGSARKRTKSEDSVKSQASSKAESDRQVSPVSVTPSPVRVTPSPVRVSPRNTPTKENTTRSRDRSRQRTPKEGDRVERRSERSAEKKQNKSVDKGSDKSESSGSSVAGKNVEKSSVTLSKTKVKSRTNQAEKADSPNSGNVSKTQANPVIKRDSGSRNDKDKSELSAKGEGPSKREVTASSVTPDSTVEKVEKSDISPVTKETDGSDEVKNVEENNKPSQERQVTPEKQNETNTKSQDKPITNEKGGRKKERKKESASSPSKTKSSSDSVKEERKKRPSKERDKFSEVVEDNMHYIKKKQLLISGGITSGNPQSAAIQNTNIDVNQSVTDQIARAGKLSSLNGEERSSGSTSSTLSSPVSDTNTDRNEARSDFSNIHPRENKSAAVSTGLTSAAQSSNTNSSWSHDERSQSRNSEERCSSGLSDEVRRPSSRIDDVKSSKNSPASSPLIIDRAEPVHPYRDPELMRKNPVQSNVPSMINPNKSTYPTVHNPIPTPAARPASVGMTSTPLTMTSSHTSSRTPVIPSVAYPSPIPLAPSLSATSLIPGLHQLDPAALAIHQRLAQQQQIAALAQYSNGPYSNVLSMSYPPHGSLNSAQLEHLWQQKYPKVPVPPPWLLTKHQEDLILDVRLKQEQMERIERERLERDRLERERDRIERDRIDRERKERERRERDRMEKERIDRERREREKLDQERADRERLEREKIEKERQERERRERDRKEKEKNRILKESIDSQTAVDQHFTESLRLASKKAAQTGMWPTPSITLGTGKPKVETPSLTSPYAFSKNEKTGEIKPEEKLKQEQQRETDYRYAELMRQEMMKREHFLKQQMRQQTEIKNETITKGSSHDSKPAFNYSPSSSKPRDGYPTSIPSSGQIKQEGGSTPKFSLYGYNPDISYITAEQLHSYGLDNIKSEKTPLSGKMGSGGHPPSHRSQSPRKKDISAPPPLIKDAHSSVIVENKKESVLKSASPHAHQHYSSPGSMPSSSPHQQPKPAHTPDRSHDRGHPSSSSPGAAISHLMSATMAQSFTHSQLVALQAEAMRHGSARSQSPLRVASPHQLSQAVMQPMDYTCSPNNKPRGSPSSSSSPHTGGSSTGSISVSGTYTPAIAQPPVSLPQSSVAFSCSLIQQGLVPNPIYTHSSSAGKPGDSQRTVSVTGTAQVPRAAHTPQASTRPTSQPSSAVQQGTKRKSHKDVHNRKRQKAGMEGSLSPGNTNSALNLSIPVTTPQILTNPSPYTTTSSSSVNTASMSLADSTAATSTTQSSVSSLPTSMAASASAFSRLGFTGFMDSFKSFVENTVQNAFLSDPDLCKPNKPGSSQPSNQQQQQQQQVLQQSHPQYPQQQVSPQQQQQQQHIRAQAPQQQNRPKSSLERSCTPVSSTANIATPMTISEESTNMSTASNNSNHTLSYVETINRVANGQIDTDSDTLSAPSPPPQLKQEVNQSPNKSAKHPNLKKAWLQRHSDEDKQEVKVPPPVSVAATVEDVQQKEKEKEVLKHCYVNCSYISPSKEGGSKSPISALQNVIPSTSIPNGTIRELGMDESTTSASETETQVIDTNAPHRKRVKTKKERNTNAKKAKTESEDGSTTSSTTSSASSQPRKKSASRRSKETKDPSKPKVKKTVSEPLVNGDDEKPKGKSVETRKEKAREKGKESPMTVTEEVYDHRMDEESKQSRSDCPSPKPPTKLQESSSQSTETAAETRSSSDNARKQEKKEKKKSNKEKKEKKLKEKEKKEKEEEREKERGQAPTPPLSQSRSQKESETKSKQGTGGTPSTSGTFTKPLVRAPVSVLKKTCEPFLQDGSCSEVTPKLMKCRECKMTPTQRSKNVPNIFCRFYAFRRLKYSQRGFLTIDGFSELTDADADDINPWVPRFPVIEPKIDVETSKFILTRVGHKFCELVQQEKEATALAGDEAQIAWKRAVTGVREMCDACDTTLFNMHWVCRKCGFVVCLDCYTVKAKELEDDKDQSESMSDDMKETQREWLTCSSNRQPHDVDKLMLTQIIPRDALWEVGRLAHDISEKWNITLRCQCRRPPPQKNGIKQSLMKHAMKQLSPAKNKKLVNGIGGDEHVKSGKTKNGNIKNVPNLAGYHPDSSSPLSLLADVASMDSENSRERSESPFTKKKEGKHGKSYNPITEPVSPCMDGDGEKKMPASCSTLRELLTKTAGKVKNNSESNKKKSKNTNSLDDIIQSVVEKQMPKEIDQINTLNSGTQPMKLLHYTPRNGPSSLLVRDTPILVHNLTETSVLYPDVPHSWLCDGRLLRLHDPRHKGNLKIFMEQWKRGQPVLVSGVDKNLNLDLWHPKVFSKQFGEIENDLINCRTGCLVVGQPMKHFWDGFVELEERLVDEEGEPMLLKLKDWPPGEDFSDVLPHHFQDLMQALPLPEYTRRDGRLNLASRLPDFLVKPDLGPKMYNAYGSASYPKEGTTNLHLDVSDATNVMVHVGVLDEESKGMEKDGAALKAIEEAGVDIITKRRVHEVREVPGALWHIFDAVDADKIRDFLNMVAKERGEEIELYHDPIHDQSWYLDEGMRERLAKEYGVLGYTIIQCLGDAIFIPAGAPHQVRNLNNCIKVAEDFVSPEHLHHCFRLTQEFRDLSDGHSNHEDKLQVKNIIYHAVKDAVAVLEENDPDEED